MADIADVSTLHMVTAYLGVLIGMISLDSNTIFVTIHAKTLHKVV